MHLHFCNVRVILQNLIGYFQNIARNMKRLFKKNTARNIIQLFPKILPAVLSGYFKKSSNAVRSASFSAAEPTVILQKSEMRGLLK